MLKTQVELATQTSLLNIMILSKSLFLALFRPQKKDTNVSSVKSNAMEYRESEVDEDLAFKYYKKKMGYAQPGIHKGIYYYLLTFIILNF